ncbi:MAG TPA: TetR/AcrR family transcriptional regulator [Acidimicrobiales bacterium]|nr:TetR/AcrR family transcriptional regulator [Acidimicrobiales bacterium]
MALDPLTPERRRQQTREYLLRAAAEVLARRGFHGASLDEVAATAGYTKGAVYSNFKNKEDLFLALLEAIQQREMDQVEATIDASDVPPEARLGDFVSLFRRQSQDLGENWDVLYQEFALYAMRNDAAREKLTELDAAAIDRVGLLIAAEGDWRRPEASTRHLARMIVALFHGVGLMRALDPGTVDDAFLESVMAFLARGLLTEAPDGLAQGTTPG